MNSYYDAATPTQPRQAKILGLRRKTFWFILAGCILVVVILAAVLGGVLGSRHHDSTEAHTPSSLPASNVTDHTIVTQKNGGYTILIPAGNNNGQSFYTYYLAVNGSIIERHSQTISDPSNSHAEVQEQVIVDSGTTTGTPLAAVSWTYQDLVYRQLFYVGGNAQVMTTNTSGADESWGSPYSILTNGAQVWDNSVGLTAYASNGTSGLKGIRVYYGSSHGIQEVAMDFASPRVWNMWTSFPGGDHSTGIATTLDNGTVAHLYYRQSSNGTLMQQEYNFKTGGSWFYNAQGPSNITSGGDMAATFDGFQTDTIFYQANNGALERALYQGGQGLTDFLTVNETTAGTKLAATSIQNGNDESDALIAFQSSNSQDTTIEFKQISRVGQVRGQGVL